MPFSLCYAGVISSYFCLVARFVGKETLQTAANRCLPIAINVNTADVCPAADDTCLLSEDSVLQNIRVLNRR